MVDLGGEDRFDPLTLARDSLPRGFGHTPDFKSEGPQLSIAV